MTNQNVPEYIRQAAEKNQVCKVLRISTDRKTGLQSAKEIEVPAKVALKELSKDFNKRSVIGRKIQPLGVQLAFNPTPIADVTALSDDALRIEFEKRGLGIPAVVVTAEPVATEPEQEVRRGPGRPPKTETVESDEKSALSDLQTGTDTQA